MNANRRPRESPLNQLEIGSIPTASSAVESALLPVCHLIALLDGMCDTCMRGRVRCAERAGVRTPFGIVCRHHSRVPVVVLFLQHSSLGCSLSSLMMLPCSRASCATRMMLFATSGLLRSPRRSSDSVCVACDKNDAATAGLLRSPRRSSDSVMAVVLVSTSSQRCYVGCCDSMRVLQCQCVGASNSQASADT